ncbi:MAG TPA: cupin domain-containing protein, partial [Acidimicrobiales bacterium]|nr:cupin domain-containing protein [Acidimicrobiales bacterium]
GDNVWQEDLPSLGDAVRGIRLVRAPDCPLVAAVWELDPGAEGPYHLHHGTDEYLIVLRGRPTLRTPDGERELAEGEAVQFPRGLTGAHQISNRSEDVVRYVMAAYHGTPEVIEYPDDGTVVVGARTAGADGRELFRRFDGSSAP